MAVLKGEVVNQFTADRLGSTTSSVSSATAAWRLSSPSLSSTHEPPPNPVAPSRLGVPSSKVHFMAVGGACSPLINLNRTPVAGESLSGHNKTPYTAPRRIYPMRPTWFGQMPTQPTVDEVLPWSSPFVHFHLLSWHGHSLVGRHLGRRRRLRDDRRGDSTWAGMQHRR
jgi:hypothetical protein